MRRSVYNYSSLLHISGCFGSHSRMTRWSIVIRFFFIFLHRPYCPPTTYIHISSYHYSIESTSFKQFCVLRATINIWIFGNISPFLFPLLSPKSHKCICYFSWLTLWHLKLKNMKNFNNLFACLSIYRVIH